MSQQLNYLDVLRAAVQLKHQCQATHQRTVFVQEKTGENEIVWEGFVAVFDLTGHEEARIGYAWPHISKNGMNGVKIVTMLGSQVIDSPQRAVQAAIFMDEELPTPRL